MYHHLLPALIATTGLALVVSCAKPPRDLPKSTQARLATKQAALTDPNDDLARRVLAAYQAGKYSDRASLTLTYLFKDGRRETSTTAYQTRFKTPNLLRLQVTNVDNEVSIWCDGERLIARVIDPRTDNFDGQLAVCEAPAKLAIADLYRATELVDPVRPDELLSVLMAAPAGLELTPLSLLLDEGRLLEILRAARAVSHRSADAQLQLESTVQEGTFRFWVDPTSLVIRRMDFPSTTTNLPENIQSVELRAEFLEASFVAADQDGTLDEALSNATHKVTRFVLPPIEPATALLGESIAGLQFIDASGTEISIPQQAGPLRVLVWFNDHPSSRAVVEQIDALRRQIGSDGLEFFAVSVDQVGPDPSRLLRQWQTSLDGLGDPLATGRDCLGIRQAPTTVVIGRDGHLHYFDVGANPYLAADLSVVIERLQRGEDVAKATINQHKLALTAYRRQLSMATPGDGQTPPPNQTLHPPAAPEQLRIRQLWTTEEISEPGNMLLIPGKEPSVLVLDGWNQLVQLNSKGKVIGRFNLELPPHEGVSIVRSGVDGRGNVIIAAAARGGHRAFVFEPNGKRLMQHPDDAESTVSLGDLMLADLDGNETPELYVGWQGNAGVYGVRLDGGRAWNNRAMLGVTSLALAASIPTASRDLVVAGQSGAIVLVDQHGRTRRQLTVGDRPLHQVATWPGTMRQLSSFLSTDTRPRSTDASLCGLSFSAAGDLAAIGINSSFEVVWEQPLSSALFQHQVDLPQTITVGDRPLWLIPAGDGSVSFVSADGRLTDRLYTGQHLRGVGAIQDNGQSILILATAGTVTGYAIATDD